MNVVCIVDSILKHSLLSLASRKVLDDNVIRLS